MEPSLLIKKCLEKDQNAWDHFIKSYTPIVRKGIIRRLKDYGIRPAHDHVNDIVQEVFLYLWEKDKLSQLRHIEALRSWLSIIAFNTASNYCKKVFFRERSAQARSLEERPDGDLGLCLLDIIPDPRECPDQKTELADLRARLREKLSDMPPRTRLALTFSLLDGLSQKEIASIMNLPRGTISAMICRGRRVLSEKICDHP
ncbi:MAG: sigma-70 family RNA polymerase sigma factor [Candidatus Omnitrophica bacterium]|nr:sigma-70 family RNA polymerase sigma factor [Candidatus Omnitrophota bacterium]